MEIESKIGVFNSSKSPRIVYVEPWANDYTLRPEEGLVITASGGAEMPWFDVVEWEGATQVYCNNTTDFKVFQDGRELKCGHNKHE